ncbi:uncharacterized protein LOC135217498 [Macrobrachium nipponense]|uniref:uncharacterized protein LOC135217498 n=1 Tax=Macrobrachium nipponense TaxID=159736 RepID=UPI0030C84314
MEKIILLLAICGLLFSIPANAQACTMPFEPIGTQCLYVDSLEHGSFYDMRLYCAKQGTGGKLVKIPDASQLEAIITYILDKGLDHYHYWIDATDEDHEGVFTWGDGTLVPEGAPFWKYDCDGAFTLRPHIDGNSNCAILDSEYYFLLSDTSCLGDVGEIQYSPICEQV